VGTQNTAGFIQHHGQTGTVIAGTGAGMENPTCRLPVPNPIQEWMCGPYAPIWEHTSRQLILVLVVMCARHMILPHQQERGRKLKGVPTFIKDARVGEIHNLNQKWIYAPIWEHMGRHTHL
jgi:hypothetical protein